MKKNIVIILGVVVLVAVAVSSLKAEPKELERVGSVNIANEYHATTTLSTAQDPMLIKTGNGTLGSIVVGTPSTAGTYICYNATTTNVNLRTPGQSTSTIEIATLKAAPVGGTYTFDAAFTNGLICDEGGSFDGIYTTTWR